ncbi:DUF4177 domain-containing protein [Croceivirga radicis]|uniref:DUF4177 domain-containing protein n=1 Tax=Croceivirga radicis TaxID=1929488 RepID=UPI0003141AA1|nr:DUF4177 domain-containing protein [Croceivirga radicis]
MKEYKVVQFKHGLTNNNQKLEDLLNSHAHQGWEVKQYLEQSSKIIFERNKNR